MCTHSMLSLSNLSIVKCLRFCYKINLKKDSGYIKGKHLIIIQPLMDKYLQTVRVKAHLAMDATLLRDLS